MEEKQIKEMENVSNVIKKRVADLTRDDVKLLQKLPVTIEKVINRKTKNTYYNMSVKLHEFINLKPTDRNDQLTESEYNYFKVLFNSPMESNPVEKNIHCRFFKGLTSKGTPWYKIQVIFAPTLYKNIWLKQTEVAFADNLISKGLLEPIVWIENEDIYDTSSDVDPIEQFS